MIKMIKWTPDYTSYIHPDLIEIVFEHANNSSLEKFRITWTPPNLDIYKNKLLLIVSYTYDNHNEIFQEKIILDRQNYFLLMQKNPSFTIKLSNDLMETTFSSIIKKVIFDPHRIFLEINTDSNKSTVFGKLIHNALAEEKSD